MFAGPRPRPTPCRSATTDPGPSRTRRSWRPLALALAAGWGLTVPAAAQLVLPGGQGGGTTAGTVTAPPAAGRAARPDDGPPRPRALGPLRPIREADAIGKPFALNGVNGRILIESGAEGALRARVTLVGRSTARPGESCTVELGDANGVALTRQPVEGLTRVVAQAPQCPLRMDLLEGAVLVSEPRTPCVFEAQACRADVAGLWGPGAASLAGRGPEFERARAAADTALREAYRALAARFDRARAAPVVSEQASFSSERATACRDYDREAQFSFCAARFTEGRLALVRARLAQP